MAAAAARVFRGCRVLMSPAATPAAGKAAKPAAAKVTKAAAAAAKENRGIMRPLPISDALRRFVGAPEVSRVGATKLIWAHIKANGLQSPTDKRVINLDDKLKSLFGEKDKIGMMEIAKLLKPHFPKTN
ncbi:hypothetical protein ACP4OV_009586 [Aristida adscensionis]